VPQPLLDLWNTIQTYPSLVPWLILLFLAWLILRNRLDFSTVSPRLKRLRLGPTGFEIELFELQKAAEKAAAEVASAQTETAPGTAGATDDAEPPSQVVTHERAAPMTAAISVSDSARIASVETVDIERSGPRDDDVVETVLQEFTVDPKVALMRLSTAIERELTRLLAGAGFLAGRTFLPIPNAVDIIRKQYRVLPEAVLSALEAFWKVRNERRG
jgi:hypothetical protein